MFKRYVSVVFKKDMVTLKLLEEATHAQIMDYLRAKLVPLKRLYKDEKIPIMIKGRVLKNREMDEISALIKSKIDVDVEFEMPREMGLHTIVRTFEKNTEVSETKFHKGSIRSGNKIEAEGSIVIIGDVNSGAEVIATENIVVVGSLRGLAHAGAKGNRDAIIAASRIDTMQLRIANVVRKMDKDNTRAYLSATAFVNEDKIVID